METEGLKVRRHKSQIAKSPLVFCCDDMAGLTVVWVVPASVSAKVWFTLLSSKLPSSNSLQLYFIRYLWSNEHKLERVAAVPRE